VPLELSNGLRRNKTDHRYSEDRTSSMQVRADSIPPPLSGLCESVFPLYNAVSSQNICPSSLSSFGTQECGCPQTSLFYMSLFVPQFKTGNKSFAGQQYQGEEEEGAVEKRYLPYKENCFIPEDYDMSRTVPVKSKEVHNVMDHHGVMNQGINKYSRKCSKEEVPLCIEDMHPLIGEESNCRNSGHEEVILISYDSDNDVTSTFNTSDGCEQIYDTNDDDIEIIFVSKNDVNTRDISLQQKSIGENKIPSD
jgi:hypothetical protein